MRRDGLRSDSSWYSSAFLGLNYSGTFAHEAEQLYKAALASGIQPDARLLGPVARFAVTADAPQLADFFIAEATRMNLAQSQLFEQIMLFHVPAPYRKKIVDFCMWHMIKLRVVPTAELGRLLLMAAARCGCNTGTRDLMLRELQAHGMPVTDSHRSLVETTTVPTFTGRRITHA